MIIGTGRDMNINIYTHHYVNIIIYLKMITNIIHRYLVMSWSNGGGVGGIGGFANNINNNDNGFTQSMVKENIITSGSVTTTNLNRQTGNGLYQRTTAFNITLTDMLI